MFYYDKKCIVKRYSSTLGQYNRPVNTLADVGSYECALMMTKDSNSTKKTFAEVPAVLKDKVKEILIDLELPELAE